MHQQPNAWRIDILKRNPDSLRTIAKAAKRMLTLHTGNQLAKPHHYTCVRLPRYAYSNYSVNVLKVLGQEFVYHNYGYETECSAFINDFIDESYAHVISEIGYNPIRQNRSAAYITNRKMWLNYIINMAELYAPID